MRRMRERVVALVVVVVIGLGDGDRRVGRLAVKNFTRLLYDSRCSLILENYITFN